MSGGSHTIPATPGQNNWCHPNGDSRIACIAGLIASASQHDLPCGNVALRPRLLGELLRARASQYHIPPALAVLGRNSLQQELQTSKQVMLYGGKWCLALTKPKPSCRLLMANKRLKDKNAVRETAVLFLPLSFASAQAQLCGMETRHNAAQ